MKKVMLSVDNLVCGYVPEHALFSPVSFDCHEGEIIAILGTNGRGKTTLLHSLLGILPALKGHISCSQHMGFVPQLFTPAFSYRVLDIVLMGRSRHIGLFGSPTNADISIAR